MMYRRAAGAAMAISQPAHAWISGQLARRLAAPLDETFLLAAEQHDIGWLDWERDPGFDPASGLPPTFREVGAAVHAPMWTAGVERALAAWGPQVALLISRHGGRIYRRFGLPSAGAEDAAAIRGYLDAQAPKEAEWAQASGLDARELERRSDLIAFVDALSLAVCGNLRLPVDLETSDGVVRVEANGEDEFRLGPWPFATGAFVVEGEGRPLPPDARFADAEAMRRWLASPKREAFAARLAPA